MDTNRLGRQIDKSLSLVSPTETVFTKEEGIGRIVASKVCVGLLRPVEERDRHRLNLMIWIQARLLGVE